MKEKGTQTFNQTAFTLAEVLITLGIIGIVAAMTLPSIITSYQKKETSVRLKRFYTTYINAVNLSKYENGGDINGAYILTSSKNPEQMLEWYNTFLAPYLKTSKVVKTDVGIEAVFLDGSAMLIAKNGCAAGTSCTHVLYCTHLKYCEDSEVKNNASLDAISDAQHTFTFFTSGPPLTVYEFTDEGTISTSRPSRAEALRLCKHRKRNCTPLLFMDNWEIKDDYPY